MKILLAVSLILLLSFGVCFRSRAGAHSKAALVVYALCFLNAVGIGYFGGELVFGTAKAVVQQNESSEPARATYADVGKIFSDERGQMDGIAAIIREVTERWNQEKATKQRLAQLESQCQSK
jgi:hypothetical protein